MFSSARKDQHIRIKPLALSQPHNLTGRLALSGAFAVPKHQFKFADLLIAFLNRLRQVSTKFVVRAAMTSRALDR